MGSAIPFSRTLVFSQGDPLGVGPDLLLFAASANLVRPGDRVYASFATLLARAQTLMKTGWRGNGLEVLREVVVPSVANRDDFGQFAALEAAVDDVLSATQSALVTAPLDKAAAALEGLTFPGHTEYLAQRAGVSDFAMLMAGPTMRVVLATIHMALRRVPVELDAPSIVRVGVLLARALRELYGVTRPRIGVLGLNPHAGEKGLLGREDIEVVEPAVLALQAQLGDAAEVFGPLPADTACFHHVQGRYDGLIAMYHDQGLAPFKLIHFHDGVNVTLGLPFVRTSPDHGTARDLAGSGRVDPRSFYAAIALARGEQM